MDAVKVPSETVPDGMKTCEQILKRAKELKKAEPVIAYWCCFAAAQNAIKVPSRTSEGTKWLMTLLDALEQMKAVLGHNEAVTSEAAGAAYIENFALKVFMSADNDDRAGISGKATIRKFVVAGQFIEVLKCFENGMTEEMEQKLQYARWKAADGAKALREGRDPISGPPIPESDISSFPEQPVTSPATLSTQLPSSPSSGGALRRLMDTSIQSTPVVSPNPSPATGRLPLPDVRTAPDHLRIPSRTPTRTTSSGSGAWSTVATPGLADANGEERHFDLIARPTAPPASPPERRSPVGERKNVRFLGPDGAPLSPATTQLTVGSYDAPPAPPPTDFASSPTSPSLPPIRSAPSPLDRSRGDSRAPTSRPDFRPRIDSSSSANSIPRINGNGNGNGSSSRAGPPSTSQFIPPPPPPSLASYPSVPPVYPASSGLGVTSPSPLPSAPSAAMAPTRKQVEQTQKHARWAISALDFDDVETAKLELRKALANLGG